MLDETSANFHTDARAVFETTVTRFAQNPLLVLKAKPLFHHMHDFESRYGDLSQVAKLEGRMRDLYPSDPQLKLFGCRYSDGDFDPTVVQPIISPARQARPKGIVPPPMIERPSSAQDSPRLAISIAVPQTTLSPKRQLEESDNESGHARKIPRSESPLKGAAGRRLDAKRSQLRQELHPGENQAGTPLPTHVVPPPVSGPAPLPPEIHRLLTMIPRAESYNATTFSPHKMMDLLRNIDLARAQLSRSAASQTQLPSIYGFNQPRKSAVSIFMRDRADAVLLTADFPYGR